MSRSMVSQTSAMSKMDHPLTPDDVYPLYNKYFDARSRWYGVGSALRISAGDLKAIEKDNRGICEDCFREVLLKWLRRQGRKTESELTKAAKIHESHNTILYFYYTVAFLIVLLACAMVFASYAINGYYARYLFKTDPIIIAAQNLKAWYKNQPVIGFKLLDYATDMPFINVTVEGDRNLWELLHSIDLKHWQLQRNSTAEDKLKRLIITGHPGAGKTTLMRYLAKEWANGRRLQSCRILFLIHLDTLPKGTKPLSLSDLLKMSPLKDYLSSVEEISMELTKQGTGACFLLDSYDGWYWRDDFINDLIFEAKLHSSLCVLTSRPSKELPKCSYIERVQILGFDSSHLEEYLRTLCTNDAVTKSILDLWESNHNVKEMCGLPLYMVMLIFIAKHDGKLDVRTKTEIYISFLNTVIKHFDDHHPQWNTVSLRECISNIPASNDDEICVAFKHLHCVAYKMLLYHEDEFPDHLKTNENINKLGFVNITKVKSIPDQVRYTFFHPTFLESFAAIHLLTLPQEQRLYLYIKDVIEHRRFYELPNFWLFFFGLIGEHYGSDISANATMATLKQINMYFFPVGTSDHPRQRLLGCCYGILDYIRELDWTGKKLIKLLESTGTLVNSSLCIENIIGLNELNSLKYILSHANNIIKEFRIGGKYRYFIFKVSNHGLEANFIEATTACLNTSGNIGFSSTLSSITHIHFDVWEDLGVTVLNCLLKTASNLHSLHVGLEGLDFEAHSRALIAINDIIWRKTLQTLDMSVELECGQLPAFVSKLNSYLPNELILTLKINLTVSYESQLDECQTVAPLLGTLIKPHRLKELTFVLPRVRPFLSTQEWIMLHQLAGLKHLSIGFNNLGPINDKILDGLSVLNKLGSLKIWNIHVGNSAMESLLKSLPQLTLQKLTLDNDNLTDHDIGLLAKVLSDSMYELESLSLRYNSITGKGIKVLVKALESHSTFYSLDLSGNPIEENEGLETLQELNTLRVLNLTNCGIGDVGFEKLVKALASNKNLRFLNLSSNPFIGSETGLAPLAKLTSLHQLDITDCSNKNQAINNEDYDENLSSIPMDLDQWDVTDWSDKKQAIKFNKKRDETINNVLKHLTQLRLLNLCSRTDVPIHWSHELASTLNHLSELQLFNAPCLRVG